MFTIMKRLAGFYLAKPVILDDGMAEAWLRDHADITVVTSKSPLASIKPVINVNSSALIIDPPIEVEALDAHISGIHTPWIVGIGAGRIMDASKYLAMRTKRKLCLIPSALSTTSWLNMAIALRKNGSLFFPGTKHATTTIVDPTFIAKAPPSLTLGGIADILAACSAITDWKISGEKTGEKVSSRGVEAFKVLVEKIIGQASAYKQFSRESILLVYETFLEALSLCGASFSGRPVEGSEHFLYYFAEEECRRKFVHGEIIALMTILSLKMQGNRAAIAPERLKAFFKEIGVPCDPRDLSMTRDEMGRILRGITSFVASKHPYSILNEHDVAADEQLMDWLFSS